MDSRLLLIVTLLLIHSYKLQKATAKNIWATMLFICSQERSFINACNIGESHTIFNVFVLFRSCIAHRVPVHKRHLQPHNYPHFRGPNVYMLSGMLLHKRVQHWWVPYHTQCFCYLSIPYCSPCVPVHKNHLQPHTTRISEARDIETVNISALWIDI